MSRISKRSEWFAAAYSQKCYHHQGQGYSLMSLVYEYDCAVCKRRIATTGRLRADLLCRECWQRCLEVDEERLAGMCAELLSNAQLGLKTAAADIQRLRLELNSFDRENSKFLVRAFSWLWNRPDRAKLAEQICVAEGAHEFIGEQIELIKKLPDRLRAPRSRFKSRKLREEQVKTARLERRAQIYERARSVLNPDRSLLMINKDSYRRGNRVDNYIRKCWRVRIEDHYAGRCFICGSINDLTLDHLWMSKNEGGDFAMRIRGVSGVVSNVLVLCRGCNSAKGDRRIERIVQEEALEELLSLQKRLTTAFNQDRDLIRRLFGHVAYQDSLF